MGVTSIIAILVILVLIVFAALSVTTANADLKLSQKSADSTRNYYIADGTAEEKVAEIAGIVSQGGDYEAALQSMGYKISNDGTVQAVEFNVKIDNSKALFVRIIISGTGGLQRDMWQVRPTGTWTADTGTDLIIE